MPALRWSEETGFHHESARIEQALELGVGGFIIFGGPADQVGELVASLTTRSAVPLLFGADLERGAGQQFAGLHELPPPRALGSLSDLATVRAAAAATAREALGVGIRWIFAPVADLDAEPDNPIVQTRAFGDDPAWVGACVAAWVEGCQGAGALACVKHFPGHGRTVSDSHAGLPSVAADREQLQDDLQPFRAGIAAGVASCMTAHVSYPALDPSGKPATLSLPILAILREALGFAGAVVSDALIMDGAFESHDEASAYVAAVAAGVDVLLYPRNLSLAHASLTDALRSGTLSPARIAAALEQVDRLLSRPAPVASADDPDPATVSNELADRLLDAPLLRGALRPMVQALEITVVDDDLGGPYPASPSNWIIRALQDEGIAFGSGGSRVVLAYAEPRAWKGRAGFSPENLARLRESAPGADLVVLFGHPRLAESIPGEAPILVAWHRQRLMQEAVARWMINRVRR